ncbi:MAG TPA: shikimate kinase [Bacteroidales bacterium]|jgi:shikimate kinase|nr:shikimate kinase [Bacteroidota bacterium]HJN05530.1 shikimate kinase [Bacteroidales bacterium]|tara:strand:+ start:633 stop:1139 length:507 start_codon:yes stop_codon:yes gene_type:complete
MKRIYIIGFMGVGKSTAGKKLASRLGWEFLDTDATFEKKYKVSINTFFEKYGEKLFRKLEHDVLKSTFNLNNYVISTGGGMPCYLDAMYQINRNGISVYLDMNENAILHRLQNSKQKRPLVVYKPENELTDFIKEKLIDRIPYYSQATISVPAISFNLDELLKRIKSI